MVPRSCLPERSLLPLSSSLNCDCLFRSYSQHFTPLDKFIPSSLTFRLCLLAPRDSTTQVCTPSTNHSSLHGGVGSGCSRQDSGTEPNVLACAARVSFAGHNCLVCMHVCTSSGIGPKVVKRVTSHVLFLCLVKIYVRWSFINSHEESVFHLAYASRSC